MESELCYTQCRRQALIYSVLLQRGVIAPVEARCRSGRAVDCAGPDRVYGTNIVLVSSLDAIAAWLTWQGYEVRPGRWATPRGVVPDRGRFEVFWWEQTPAGVWELGLE